MQSLAVLVAGADSGFAGLAKTFNQLTSGNCRKVSLTLGKEVSKHSLELGILSEVEPLAVGIEVLGCETPLVEDLVAHDLHVDLDSVGDHLGAHGLIAHDTVHAFLGLQNLVLHHLRRFHALISGDVLHLACIFIISQLALDLNFTLVSLDGALHHRLGNLAQHSKKVGLDELIGLELELGRLAVDLFVLTHVLFSQGGAACLINFLS